jgi:hypothetical protein
MLCFTHSYNKHGEICTNQCEKRPECDIKKTPFLIEARDYLHSEVYSEQSGDAFILSKNTTCSAPEAYENDVINGGIKIDVRCTYAHCSHSITMTLKQYTELKTENYLKYGKTSDIYCSKQCQEKHEQELKKSKFLVSGNLKNHESALIFKGVDTTKPRTKEKEVMIITGTVTEQRAKCLREELISIVSRELRGEKRKYLTSKEVQSFLKLGVSDNLLVGGDDVATAAYDTMNKCKEIYPNDISIEWINRKTRCIIFIGKFI